MNRILILAVSALWSSRAAPPLPISAPPLPPTFSWTGVYVGVNVGYSCDPMFGATSALGATGVESPNFIGAFGGGQIVYGKTARCGRTKELMMFSSSAQA
jgi:hypothetical protein